MTAPKTGLRERKKIQTRQAIRRAAYRLFDEQGYDGTTVEQIAAAADVSASTVFRYFPTKEDIVLTDEYDPLIEAALRARPADEPIVESVREAVLGLLHEQFTEEREEMVQRLRLAEDVPAVRARLGEHMAVSCGLMSDALAGRRPVAGHHVDRAEIRIVVAAITGAWSEGMMQWIQGGAVEDLSQVLDRTLRALAANFRL